MKKKLLLPIFTTVIIAILASSCNNEAAIREREKQLQDSFANIVELKEMEIESLFEELNEIDEALTKINSTYLTMAATAASETTMEEKHSIKDKINRIEVALEDYKRRIANANYQIRKTNNQNSQLQGFVNNLELRIEEQEEQIQALTKEIEAKNIEIASLNKNIDNLSDMNKLKDAQIMKIEDEKHIAYFAIGTRAELMDKDLIDRKGGFLWIGRSAVVSSEVNYENLTQIDIRNTQEIPLLGSKTQVVSPHPASSYVLEGDEKKPSSIRIVNPEQFWKSTRCLIIMVE